MSNIIDSIQLSGVTYDIGGSGGVPESAFTAYTASTNSRISEDEEVTAAALNDLNESLSGKQETLIAGSGITISGNVISATGGGSITIDPSLDSGSTNAVANSAITNAFENINDRLSEDEEVTAAALNDLNERISGGSGNPTIELTQSQYDALVESGTVQSNTYYIITDASAGDLTQYWTSAQTNSAITAAVSGKQDTLSAGTGIDITDNVISATGGGGGGKAVSGGTNISITTGETADTINCTLPISADTGGIYTTSSYPFTSTAQRSYNAVFGNSNVIDVFGSTRRSDFNALFGHNNSVKPTGGSSSSHFIAGSYNNVKGNSNYSNALFGYYNNSQNNSEFGCGQYNVSNTGSYNADKTLFSVGNGTADNARHNAFEIRQNGDIYLSLNGQDVKLQDQLGGSSITVDTSLDSGSTNAVANSAITTAISTVSAATSSNTTALGGLSLVKLTQIEYDALATKDASTLYIIVN